MTDAYEDGEFPAGWRLEGENLVHEAELHGWRLTVVNVLSAPWDGPSSLRIDPPEDQEAARESDGITAELMRSISLAEIRRTTKMLRARLGRPVDGPGASAALDRVESDHDYALMAREYVRLVEQGYRSPVTRLATAWGMSRNTISGRIRRARAMGFLAGSPGKPADRLTAKARRCLEGEELEQSRVRSERK
ncbi:hypothetical protein [Streptomyces candidus]|uniref:Uncharacterized protein n=1 Tax=Streptomyces candidus TaxID=67283 RepID=A0A7X0HFQ7_9ACTN|nr:hypothetical protein [Streptomyces candidus]MBB6435353.1 hypothetical protein [Streptomyces candidus]GHH47819.1 hypothetical protein GCM10018773_41010 [Streptomyces candidus]